MKRYLVRMMCPSPYFYSPLKPRFVKVYAENEEEAKKIVSERYRLCSNIEVTELTEE